MNFGYYPYQNNSYQNNPYQQQMMQMQQQNNNGNFIHVPSEEAARAYSVAPGGSATFINDNAPYCYTKTVGFSQFDTPVFRKFRLVEETSDEQKQPAVNQQETSPIITTEALLNEVNALKTRVETLENKFKEPIIQSSNEPTNERGAKNEPSNKQRR